MPRRRGLGLEFGHHPAGEPLATVRGVRPHPLDLDGLVVLAHEGAAGDRLAVDEKQEEGAARASVKRSAG